ncbi:MAG: hypothetical protein R3301_13785 [Saprospiraceae bacterium]|nr:hypothetical protein [Saprospiraceae bacterium]
MTLGDFFEICSNNPAILIFYFVAVPLTALLALILARGEGHLSPWKYLYTALIYLACVPGIFALTLNVYLFLFERQSIMDTNLFTQILPLISMVITLYLVRRNVSLDAVPGFDKLGGLLIMIIAVLSLMWILDKTRIIAFTYIPLIYVVLILVAILVAIRFGMRRMGGS